MTPRQKRPIQIETKTNLPSVPPMVQNCSLESSNVMEALGRLETQVSKLIYLSEFPPTQRQHQHEVLPHVRLYILASTVSSMLLAASIMHLGDIWQFDAICRFESLLILRLVGIIFFQSPKISAKVVSFDASDSMESLHSYLVSDIYGGSRAGALRSRPSLT